MKKIGYILFAALFLSLVTSCYSPNPLYGTWEDNSGSSIIFVADNTFNAKIAQPGAQAKRYSGSYSVIANVIVFSMDDGTKMNAEWDIRGSFLFLDWYDSVTMETKKLKLSHTSK